MHLNDLVRDLTSELENFEDIARYLRPQPGDLPKLAGIDIHGGTLPLKGSVGGDHVIYLDFKERFDLERRIQRGLEKGRLDLVDNLLHLHGRAAVALLDVSGHRVTDAFLAAMVHQAFLLGTIYELDTFGRITGELFENLNTRLYQSSGDHKFVSMTYGEIAEDNSFRFLSAAQPGPAVFSQRYDRLMETAEEGCVSYPPLGMMPSQRVTERTTDSVLGYKEDYRMNEWTIEGEGDILLLFTDGLLEHGAADHGEPYYPRRLEDTLREVKDLSSRDIFEAVTADVLLSAEPADDISLVVVKRVR
jgi:serine phosphatase RsbU (regulator of sigma subunit)